MPPRRHTHTQIHVYDTYNTWPTTPINPGRNTQHSTEGTESLVQVPFWLITMKDCEWDNITHMYNVDHSSSWTETPRPPCSWSLAPVGLVVWFHSRRQVNTTQPLTHCPHRCDGGGDRKGKSPGLR